MKERGNLKIEFYSHLEEINEMYFNQGKRVFKILHSELSKKYNLKISYKMFCYYAKKEFKKNTSVKLKDSSNPIAEIKKEHEPVIARPEFAKIKKYNPHTTSLSADQIIGYKK